MKNKLWLGILIGVLVSVIIGLTGFIIYDKVLIKTNDIAENNGQNENSNVNIEKECDSLENKMNDYQKYVNSLKQNRKQNINRIDDVSINEKLGISYLVLSNNGEVILGLEDSNLISKYGNSYQVLTSVLSADILEYGNSGFRTILFIKEDGSLAAINGNDLINNKTINLITDFGTASNIVDVVQTSDNYSMSIMAIDINGNTFDLTNYLQ